MVDEVSERVPSRSAQLSGDGRRVILGAQLAGADLAGESFTQRTLKNVDLSGANLAGSQWLGARLERVNLSGADLTDADLRGAELKHVDLSGADLGGADLCGVEMSSVDLKGAKANGTVLTGSSVEDADFSEAELTGVQFDGATVRSTTFDHTALVECQLGGTTLEQCEFTDVTFDRCDLSALRVDRGQYLRTSLTGCKGVGAAFIRARLQALTVGDSTLTACFLNRCDGMTPEETEALREAGAKIGPAGGGVFRGKGERDPGDQVGEQIGAKDTPQGGGGEDAAVMCSARLPRLKWSEASLGGVNLANAELNGTSLSQADLRGADLRSAEFSGVDLSDADLRGADLRGTIIEDTLLTRARLDGADLRGASLTSVNLTGARLDQARLDGCRIEDGMLSRASLTAASAPGVVTHHCAFRDTTWTECELSGSHHQHARFEGAVFDRCQLRGMRLKGANLARLSVAGSDMEGSLLVRCHGLKGDARTELEQAGAHFQLTLLARARQEFAGRPRLRWGLVAAFAALAVTVIVLVSVPATWPTSWLLQRMGTIVDLDTQRDCSRYVRLGRVLQGRETPKPAEQATALLRMDACFDVLPELRGERVGLLGRVEQILNQRLEDDSIEASERFDILNSLRDVYMAQGADQERDPRWADVHQQLARAIAAMPMSPFEEFYRYEPVLESLVVLGEYDLATQIIERIAKHQDEATLWTTLLLLLDQIGLERGPAEAVAFLSQLGASAVIEDHPVGAMVTLAHVDLLLSEEQEEAAAAMADSVEAADPPASGFLATLIRARIELAGERTDEALAHLASLPTEETVSTELLGHAALTGMEAQLADGAVSTAFDTIAAYLETVEQPAVAERVVDEAVDLAVAEGAFALFTERTEGIENPVVVQILADADLQLENLRQRALAGDLSADDPLVVAVFQSGDHEGIREVVALLLAVETEAELGEIVAELTTIAGEVEGDAGQIVGLTLVEGALYDRASPHLAKQVADELDLWSSVDEAHMGTLLEAAALVALAEEDFAGVEAILERATKLESRDGNILSSIAGNAMARLQELGRCEDAIDIADSVLAHIDEPMGRAYCREQLVMCLVALDRSSDVSREVSRLAKESSPCLAQQAEVQAHDLAGNAPIDRAPMLAACSRGGVPSEHSLRVMEYLCNRGDFEDARELLDAVGVVDPHCRAQWAVTEAMILESEGRTDDALAVLDESYGEATDPWEREMLATTELGLLAGLKDGDGIIERYLRFSSGLPASERRQLWTRAAESLIQVGQKDRLPDLGEDPQWLDSVSGSVAISEVRVQLDDGDVDGALESIEALLEDTMEPSMAEEIGWYLSEAAQTPGAETRALASMEVLLESLERGGDAWLTLSVEAARILDMVGRTDEAIESIRELVALDLSSHQLEAMSDTAAAIAGNNLGADEFEELLSQLEAKGLAADRVLYARLGAASGMLGRDGIQDARKVLKPIEGRALTSNQLRGQYCMFVGAWYDPEQDGQLEELLARFKPADPEAECLAHVDMVRCLPWDSEDQLTALKRAAKGCPAGLLDLWDIETMADTLSGAGQGAEALKFLDAHAPTVSAADRPRLRMVRARTQATAGDLAAARETLEELAEDTSDIPVAAEAMAWLLMSVYPQDETTASTAVKRTDRAVELVGEGTEEARMIRSQLVEFHAAKGDTSAAIELLTELLADMPPGVGSDRARALTRLARLQLEKNEGRPDRAVLRNVDEAIAASRPGECCLEELIHLKPALEIVQRAGEGRDAWEILQQQMADVPETESQAFFDGVTYELDMCGNASIADKLREQAIPDEPDPG
jgi:uncharacterized protein YjbI with pentapeptide repeats/tetratricopeptide (TPR) repeat protein